MTSILCYFLSIVIIKLQEVLNEESFISKCLILIRFISSQLVLLGKLYSEFSLLIQDLPETHPGESGVVTLSMYRINFL